jgi:ribonucleotide reductase alpha subunit
VTAPLDGTVEVTYTCRADHPDFDAITAVAPSSWVVENPAVAAARGVRVIEVADTREGWVDAYCAVIDAATQVGHHQLMFVVSGIRPHGAELKTFGGHASGPAPLVKALVGIAEVVNRAGASGRLIGALESMEIDHLIAESVVAGGARRSARLAALHWTDPEILDFISCKADGRSHWSANISVEIDGAFRVAVAHNDQLALQVLAAVAVGMATNGEPGLIDTELMSLDEPRAIRITNPCVTGDSWAQTTSGLRQVRDLLGAGQVDLLVNDEVWSTGAEGFFETGTKPVLRLDVDGTALRVTADHLISTPDGWRPAGDLTAGDVVDLTDSLGNTWDGPGTEAEGYLLGHLAGDGSFLTGTGGAELAVWDQDGHGPEIRARLLELIETAGLRHRSDWEGWHAKTGDDEGKWVLRSAALRDLATRFGIARGTKTITPEVMAASSEFVTGFLRGLFDTDGHVEGTSTGSGITVRLSQSDAEMLGNARILLLALGIKSAIRSMKPAGSKDLPGGTYEVRESFRLIISGLHTERFAKLVGFEHIAKQSKLTDGIETMTKGFYSKPMVGTVQAITTDGVEPVYDCQVPGLNAFVANGTIVHNCGEATLSTDGAEGESCNLGSVNLDAYGTDFAGAQRGFELMARFLYRATMNHHPDPSVGRIEERNRRLGVGFMGMQGWCAAHGVRLTDFAGDEALRTAMISFRLAARDAADDLADSMGLPRPVKVTAVAPVGTISQIPGTQPGLHPVKARYFIRRVRFAVAEQGWRDAEAQGYRVVDDVYAANTKVVEFIVKDSVLDRFPEALIEQSNEVTASQFFELVCAVQETFCGPGDGQAVSATGQIPVGTDPIQLAADIAPWLGRLKGVTVFPDRSFDLPPYEPLERHEYEARIAELETGAELAAGDSNDGSCSTGACPIR